MKQLYLDSEDEITSVIQKVSAAAEDKVALIPPKRTSTLQSVVNLKLLQKSAREAEKEVVIITRDPSILNIAARIKMLTAPNLAADPSVPDLPPDADLPPPVIDGSQASESDLQSADRAAAKVPKNKAGDKAGKKAKKGGKSSRAIPDFDKFKKYGLLALLALVLLGAAAWFIFFTPRAVVTVSGHTQEARAQFRMTLDTDSEEADLENGTVPGEGRESSRTLTGTFEATGSETIGKRATGSVTVTNCESPSSITIESGTALTAANGLVFRARENVTVPGSTVGSGFVCNEDGQASVPVRADEIGGDYNIGPTSYSVAGYSSDNVYGQGGNMTGGESEEVSVVTQSDIDSARRQLLEDENDTAREELANQFSADQFIIENSFARNVTGATPEPAAGGRADEGRLILQVTYTLLAADRDELEEYFSHQLLDQTDSSEGLGVVEINLEEAEIEAVGEQNVFDVTVDGLLGPEIDQEEFKAEIAGMKYARAIETIEARPNVTGAEIELSPFWVSSVPNNPDRIEIRFAINDEEEQDDPDAAGD